MGGVLRENLVKLLVGFATLLAAMGVPCHATVDPDQVTRLTPCVLPDTGEHAEAELLDAEIRFDCRSLQTDYGSGDFWVRLRGISRVSDAADPLVLRTGSVWQDAVRLRIRYADGYLARTGTTSATTSRQLGLGALIQYELPPRTAPIADILIHVEGSANIRGILLSPEVMTASRAARSDLALATLYSGFLGLSLALLCYNFALWTVMRHRFQLAYCAMLLAMMGYVFSSSGALAWAWPAIDNNDRLRINYLLLTFAVVSAIAFARHFFETRIVPRGVVRAIHVAMSVSVAATLAMITLAPWQIAFFDTLNSVAFATLLLCAVPIMAYAWIRGSRFLWVFLLAWSVPFILAIVRVLSNIGFIAPSFWIDNSTVIAMGIEALLSAVAIAWRVRLISDERDSARADETIARLHAETDSLTGLPNRRAFLASAIGLEGIQRLMLVDIDDFKRINEQIGHDGGDEVLGVVTHILRGFAPRGSPPARLGGIEFALLVPAHDAEGFSPATLIEEVRTARMPLGTRVTISIGIAEGQIATEQDWRALYRSADRALYRAKRDGGGCFRMNMADAA